MAVVNIVDKGADPTGAAPSSAAFQAAHDALPSTGGTIYAPAGDYWIDGTVITKNGIQILGDAPPGMPSEEGLALNGPTRFFSQTVGSTCLTFSGPLVGLRLENLHIDGASIGAVGLWETSIVHGDHRNVLFTGWANVAHMVSTVPSTGIVAAHERNRYVSFNYILPPRACSALILGGNETDATNADFNIWEMASIFMVRPQAPVSQYGINLANCDSNVFRDTSFWYYDAGMDASTCVPILLDNTRPDKCPAWNIVDNVDFASGYGGANFCAVYNMGTNMPPQDWPSVVIKTISPINGLTPNPNLPNVVWQP